MEIVQALIGFSIGAIIGWFISKVIIEIINKYEKK